jgi:hypothetical protein
MASRLVDTSQEFVKKPHLTEIELDANESSLWFSRVETKLLPAMLSSGLDHYLA